MKQIIIINGVYGHNPDGVSVEAKKAGDPPFSVSDAEAARLVGMGVAQISEKASVNKPAVQPETQNVEAPESQNDYNAMKAADLRQLAISHGMSADDVKALKTKKDVIKALEDADAADIAVEADDEPEEIEDDEPAPSIDAADPV